MVKNIERRNTNVLLGFFTSFIFTVQYKKNEGEVVTGTGAICIGVLEVTTFLTLNISYGLKLSLALYDNTIQARRMVLL